MVIDSASCDYKALGCGALQVCTSGDAGGGRNFGWQVLKVESVVIAGRLLRRAKTAGANFAGCFRVMSPSDR